MELLSQDELSGRTQYGDSIHQLYLNLRRVCGPGLHPSSTRLRENVTEASREALGRAAAVLQEDQHRTQDPADLQGPVKACQMMKEDLAGPRDRKRE